MSFQIRFWPSVYASLAFSTLWMSSASLPGQTSVTPSVTVAPVSNAGKIVSATFLAAPVFMLKDVPTSVVTTDLDGDGKPDLIVASATTGKVYVYLGAGKGKFASPAEYSVGGHPAAILAVDLDGDGTKDIVTANGTDGTVSVLLAIAGGKLASARVYTIGVNADLVSAGDLNGDRKQDIVVGSQAAKAVATLLNDGQGTLRKPSIQALGKIPDSIAIGDFNGDSHNDVVVANSDGSVDELLGAGDGSLKFSTSLEASSTSLSYVVSGDFNGDGKPDLAVTETGGHTLMTFLGKGDGTFSKGTSYKVGNKPSSITTVDANGDGLIDLISINQGSNTLSVLLGKGDGSFQEAMDFTVGDGPVALAAADFYGDGHAGLAVVNTSAKSINVIAGKGDGSFLAAPSYSGDLSPRGIASGDLNGDGLQDIVVTNFCGSDATCGTVGSLSVYLALKSGGYQLASTQTISSGPISVAMADLNGDGVLDVIALNRSDKTLSVLLGVGDGTLQAPSTSPLVGSPVALVVKDLDKDGKLDLAVVSDCGSAKCTQRGSVDTYFGIGDGTFRTGSSTPVNYSPSSIAAGDLNGDGILDLVVANACGKDASCNSAGTATVLLGAAQGAFNPQPDISLNNGPSSIALRAVSGSSNLDLVVSHEADNTVAVLPGNGDGTFKAASLYTVGASPRSLVIADLNGDGRPDVAVANAKDSTVSVLYGQADGTLIAGDSYAVAAGPEALTAIASTASTRASLVTANGNSGSSPLGSEITSLSNISPNGTTPTQISLTVTATSGTVNSAFTLQATMTPAPPDGETVTFSSDTVTQFSDCANPATIASGVASCTTSQLTGGQRTVTASYGGDSNFASTSASQTQTVNPVAATLTLAGPSTAPVVNQSVSYTATLGAGSGSFSPTVPSGTVSFTITGQTGVTCPNAAVVLANGIYSATCTFTVVAAGSVAVVSSYGSDTNFTVSGSSNTVNQTVSQVPITLTLAVPATPTVNQSVTYTATLSAAPPGTFSPTTPSGTVSFAITGQTAVTCPSMVPTLANGVYTASCQIVPVAAGPISVTASYGSDSNFTAASPSNTVSQTVGQAPVTLSLATPATPTVNQSVTYTATLSPVAPGTFSPTAPSGMISFAITGQTGAACASMVPTLTGGAYTAGCTFTVVTAGPVSVTASYSSDNNFTASSPSNTVNQTVNKAPVTLSLATPATPTVNQSVTYTATLNAVSPGTFSPTMPSGMVSFTITGQTGVTCPTVAPTFANGAYTASCPITPVAGGPVSVVASYGSDNNFIAASPSNTVSQTVNKAPVALSMATPATPTVNQSVTYTATLSAVAPGTFSPTLPSGMVSFAITGQTGVTCPSMVPTLANGTYTASCPITPVAAGPVSVIASYTGDNNFAASSPSNTVSQTVSMITTNLIISPTTPSSVNAAVTFTATVSLPTTGASFSPTGPGGTISFTANGTAISGCQTVPITNFAAACQTSALNTFANTIVATYTGDLNYIGSTSPTVTQSVNPIAAKTAVTAATTAVVNQPVSFTATVQGVGNGPIAPTGTVTFMLAGTTLCNGYALTPSGTATIATATATCIVAFTTVSSGYAVTATYAPTGTNFTAGTPGTSSAVVVTAASTAVTESTPTSPSSINQSVTFTASVTPQFSSASTPAGAVYYPTSVASVPVGTISFVDLLANSAPVCTPAPSVSAMSASCSTSSLPFGMHSIQATFTPANANFMASPPSTAVPENIVASPTSLALGSSTANPSVNQTVTFTATLTPTYTGNTKPQGTVVYSDLTPALPVTLCTVTVANGVVPMCAPMFATAGTHTISAAYSADQNFGTSTSNSLPVVVGVAISKTTVASMPPASTVNQSVTFTATVVASSIGNATPSGGSVTFTDITNPAAPIPLCSPVTLANSTASCSYTFTTAVQHSVVAAYGSDNNFGTSSSATYVQPVNQGATTLAAVPTMTSSAVDQPVGFAITLTAIPAGASSLAGSIALTDGSTNKPICPTVTVAANGIIPASACTTNFLAPGSHPVTAVYTNTSLNFTTSTSAPATITVTTATTTTAAPSIVPSTPNGSQPNMSFVNQQLNFSSVVTPAYSDTGLTVPSGTVVFSTATNPTVCSAILQGDGTATCSAFLGAAGSYSVLASYVPATTETNFTKSSSTGTTTQTVAPGPTTLLLTSGSPTASIATAPVIFTAVLSTNWLPIAGAVNGNLPVAGSISFSAGSNGAVASNCTSASPAVAGTAYTCSIVFPAGIGSPFTVTANFTPTSGNFSSSNMTATQTVQDFSIGFLAGATSAAYSGPLNVTQSYTNLSDPFTPVANLTTLEVPTVSGFTQNLTYICSVPGATGLTCTVTPGSGTASQSILFTASALAVPGTYTATVTATDSVTPTLIHSTSITVQVASLVQTSLSPGVTGTISVPFSVPSPQDTFSFACAKILSGGVASKLISCAPSVTSGTLSSGSASFIIGTTPQTASASPQPTSTGRIFAATFLCIPLFAFAGCFGRRKAGSRSFIRFLAAIILLVGALQTIGCGGGFNTPAANVSTSVGSYLVQVTATDTKTNVVYYAVIPVVVPSGN